MGTGYRKGKPVPVDLVSIGEGFFLHRPAAEAFLAMRAAAEADGLRLRVNSAFRSMQSQRFEWAKRQQALAEGRKYKLVAKPGWSTHQSGVSVDINRAHDDYTDNGIADGTTDEWLQRNAGRFGFTNDVKSEPWHWTYGVSA